MLSVLYISPPPYFQRLEISPVSPVFLLRQEGMAGKNDKNGPKYVLHNFHPSGRKVFMRA